jgi:hypothetical protein
VFQRLVADAAAALSRFEQSDVIETELKIRFDGRCGRGTFTRTEKTDMSVFPRRFDNTSIDEGH